MATRMVAVEARGPVRTIRIGRPPINALDGPALEELARAAAAVAADAEARVIVLTSGIPGVFCSGGDLKFWRTFTPERAREVSLAGREGFARIARLAQPTIAVLDGHVIGDGIALALSCDLRLASERTLFRLPETAYGFIPGWGTLHHLVRTIGQPRTLEMVLTGRTLDANIALAWGLLSRVHAAEALANGLDALVDSLLAMSPIALTLAKVALGNGHGNLDGTPEHETAAFVQAWGGEEWREGIAALLSKRPPRFASAWTPILERGARTEDAGGQRRGD